MTQINNPESQVIADIERLELECRDMRKRIEHLTSEEDRRVLNRQLKELHEQIDYLRKQIP